MIETEIKARVKNKEQLLEKLKKFSIYKGFLTRSDTYWKNKISIRIREQEFNCEKITIVTYKKKELRNVNGLQTEVNEEHETIIGDRKPFEEFLKDAGFKISLKKTKEVHEFQYDITNELLNDQGLIANIEVCTVPPLGDFIEIEIVSEPKDVGTLELIQNELLSILEKSGLTEDDIEPKYYSQLLKEAQENNS